MTQLLVLIAIGLVGWRLGLRLKRVNWDAWRPVGRHYLADARAVLRKPVQQSPAQPNLYDVQLQKLRPLTEAEWDAFMKELEDE